MQSIENVHIQTTSKYIVYVIKHTVACALALTALRLAPSPPRESDLIQIQTA